MTEEDKSVYLYQMKILDYLYKKNGRKILDDISEYEMVKMEGIWKEKAKKNGNDLEKLIELLWESMKDEFRYEIKRIGKNEVEMCCTFCPFAEMSISNGLKEIGYAKFCMSDYGIMRGFNEKIVFTRTKTIMQGDNCCNHHYLENE